MKQKTLLELFPAAAAEEKEQPKEEKKARGRPRKSPLPHPVPQPEPEAEQAEQTYGSGQVASLSPHDMDPFPEHPFRLYDGPALEALAESIREHGILSPLVVRPKEGGRYELLSGHNRREAALKLRLEAVPCIIREADAEEAVWIVTESNLQHRETLLPGERGRAYRLQLESLKRQQKNIQKYTLHSDDTAENEDYSHGGNNACLADKITDQTGSPRNTIYRYIRLTWLLPGLLRQVDEGKLAVTAGEVLSFLGREEQEQVLMYYFEDRKKAPDVATARLIRQRSEEATITYRELDRLENKKQKEKSRSSLTIPVKRIEQYLPQGTIHEKKAFVLEALKYYKEHGPAWPTEQEEAADGEE